MRRATRVANVGNVRIGGDYPIVIQSMTNTPTVDVGATAAQISRLAAAGCRLVRVAVPDSAALSAFALLVAKTDVPLIADIHFDYRLAVGAIERGAAEVRINPGNIGGVTEVRAVISAASRYGTALRIGVNSGSLPAAVLSRFGRPTAEAMVEAALLHEREIRDMGFENLIFSLKSSDVYTTVRANVLFSEQSDFPLHVGVTEAGTLLCGAVRSAVGIGVLLSQGIGDTIRVSLTADPVEEVRVAKEILASLDLADKQLRVVSCPTCARTSSELIQIAEAVEKNLEEFSHLPLKVAVMGCSVNGPGEAREAHVGIALAPGGAVLFRDGKACELIPLAEATERLTAEVRSLAASLVR
ncbi:MAG: flavodoxin-dependent (E)-4-hydroxy-3-methylbut-2-enyl-diphosphate synthase [Selenomonadales bacterium]|nr:flavodoxin-dependent (E)-4-hydroxy-3-methylbut-2-enyl-diphosphate synthase [Selenomonadales bacterium]